MTVSQKTKVYKNIELDARFKNKLEVYLYHRLWGFNDEYRPFIGSVNTVKNFFKLKQSKEEIRKTLNNMVSKKLIFAHSMDKLDRFGDKLFIIGSRHVGNMDGDYYYMYPEETVDNFIFKDKNGLLNTNCKLCPKYGYCSDGIDCINVLMQKLYDYENKSDVNAG